MFHVLRVFVGLIALILLVLVPPLHAFQEEPDVSWHTFMGSFIDDKGQGIAVDPSGNTYLAGWSDATWGNPINPHSGGRDAFVAKLNNSGGLEWNTFMGSSLGDRARSIAVDGIGNVYVVGTSEAITVEGGGAFVAKLNSNGQLLWNKFMTSGGGQRGMAVALDALGNVYVGGWGGWLWDTPPVEPYLWEYEAVFVAKLNPSGVELWHALMGAEQVATRCRALAVDALGNVYVGGWSTDTWGSPLNPHAGDNDAFVAKLNSSGFRQWNTFMGSSGVDFGSGIAVDDSGNVYLSGDSDATWGTPVNPHAGGAAFAAKLDSSGVRQWHTFIGPESGLGWAIAVDGGQNVYVAGVGTPGGFVAKLNHDGLLKWSTFLRGIIDEGNCITVDSSRNVYVTGSTDDPWGTPVNPRAGGWDAFVAKIESSSATPDPPAAPSNLTATPLSGTEIQLDWQDNSNNEEEFRIEMKPDGGSFTDLLSVSANATGVIVENLQQQSTYTFRVRARNSAGDSPYSNEATATTLPGDGAPCTPDEMTLCLNKGGRFKVQLDWVTTTDSGPGRVVDIGKRDSGLIYFFDDDNIELLIKVIDACGLAGFENFWVFYAATTDVEFTLTVTDTLAERSKIYGNELGVPAPPVLDTDAFATCP